MDFHAYFYLHWQISGAEEKFIDATKHNVACFIVTERDYNLT